jgi:hypothetical protein
VDGEAVGVQIALDSQDILICHSETGQRLACLLGFGKAVAVQTKERQYWLVPHSQQVDDLMVELIDLLISIRYAHPALVQLEMVLEPDKP